MFFKTLKLILSCLFLAQCASQYHMSLYQQKPAFYAYVVGDASRYKIKCACNADVYVTPASCQKIITTVLAYKVMGPSYRYSTDLYAVKQDIIISFSGDPTFTSEDLRVLLKPLKNSKIQGKIILDASLFQTSEFSPNLMCCDVGTGDARPVSAMNIDYNLLMVKKSPIDLDSYVVSKVQRVLDKLNIKGKVIIECDPYKIPFHKTLVNTVHSKTLHEIMPLALKKSNNFVYDCLYLKILSLCTPAPIKKWEEGDEIVKKLLLQYFDLDIGKALIVDGSGLSRYNRIQPKKLYELLCKVHTMQEFIDALPRSLEPFTTLQGRKNLPKNIKAKTGMMSGISGLCGYSFNKLGPSKAFVIMASNFSPPISEERIIQDAFIARVC